MDPMYDQISTYPCNVRTFPDPVLYLADLKTSWKYSPKKPVIYHRGQDKNQSFTKSVNNEALVINAEPISVMHPLNIAKNIVDSHNISSNEGGLSLIGPDAPSYLEEGKRSTVDGKRKVDVGFHGEGPHRKAWKVPAQAKFPSAKELKDTIDCHWVIAHVTHPS
nr:hypothetical protein [Tanacetum cinerariifolium]